MKTVNATSAAIKSIVAAEYKAMQSFEDGAIDRDSALCALVGAIDYVPGKPASVDAVADFAALRIEYVEDWVKLAKCERISAERQFQRVITRAQIVKPQSVEAIKKQASREAAKPSTSAKPGAKTPTAKGAKVGAADVAAASVMVALTAVENEIIRLFRKGEFALLHAKIKSYEPLSL